MGNCGTREENAVVAAHAQGIHAPLLGPFCSSWRFLFFWGGWGRWLSGSWAGGPRIAWNLILERRRLSDSCGGGDLLSVGAESPKGRAIFNSRFFGLMILVASVNFVQLTFFFSLRAEAAQMISFSAVKFCSNFFGIVLLLIRQRIWV
jgi:hypothetical protein